MKKVLAAILAAALLVSAAAACGSDTADPSGGTPESAGASGAADASAQEPYTVKLLIFPAMRKPRTARPSPKPPAPFSRRSTTRRLRSRASASAAIPIR